MTMRRRNRFENWRELQVTGQTGTKRAVIKPKASHISGFTLVEIMVSFGIVATLSAIAIPTVGNHIDSARNARAMEEVRLLEKEIDIYEITNKAYPSSLADIGRTTLVDPWGNPYQYQNIANSGVKQGKLRKDRFLVPVNSDYDLYSKGKDGQTQMPFTSKPARDDIVRANNGGYVGLAENF